MNKIYLNTQKQLVNNFQKGKNGLIALFLIFAGTTGIYSQTYCSAAATSTADDEIFNVTLGTLNNTSNCSSVGGAGSAVNQYNDYTTLVAPPVLTMGANYNLSVTVGMCGFNSYDGIVGVWIDFNQNGVFTDPNENVFMSAYTPFAVSGTVVSPGAINIPMSALAGTTRMRVVETESSTPPDPCISPTWGEVEDYNVTIIAPSPLDLGVTAFLKPLGNRVCYGTDTIVTTVQNMGTNIADFSVLPAVINVVTTGPNATTYTIAVTSGTLASYASRDYTVTTNFNMSNIGTYKLKGFTTYAGDGSALNDTSSITITKSPFFTTSALPNDSVCLGTPVQLNATFSPIKQVGTDVLENTSTTYPAPYGNYYEGAKHQFLFLASELTAAGLLAGNINSIAFNATNLNGTDPLSNFNIAIANTALTSITNFQTTGFTTYYSSASYVPVLGMNTHVFSTPFVWDGVSNIIIETCFNNAGNGFSSNVAVTQSGTPFTSTVWYNDDGDFSLCSSPGSPNSVNQRPNFYFDQPTTITYSWSPAIGLSNSSIANPVSNIMSDVTYTITANIPGCMTYDTVKVHIKPTPTPHLGNDTLVCALPMVLNANTTAGSYLWNNNSIGSSLSIGATGQYWVRATNPNGCIGSDTIVVNLGTLPIVTLGADTAFCQGSFINLYAGNPGSTYQWSNGSTNPFISVNTVGTYSVLVTNASGCQSSDIINITSKNKPNVSLVFSGQKTFCPTESGRLLMEGSPAGGMYIGAGVNGNTFNANQAGQGVYIISYSYNDANGCNNIAKDTLTVNPCVGIEELSETLGLNVYPNPNTGSFTVEINAGNELNGQITVSSIDSKVVYSDVIKGSGILSKSVDISGLANGIYYLKVETKEAVKTYKVLKQ